MALSVLLENVPGDLLALKQWVCWRYETRNGKPTKPPFQPDGTRADVGKPSTWRDFQTVSVAYLGGGFDGVGFVVSSGDPFTGVDLDGVRDPANGELDAKARAIVSLLNSYAEVSPSGRGVRIWTRGQLPDGARRKGKIEAYDGARFLTFTGHRLDGTPDAIEERGDALATFHGEYLATEPKKPQKEQTGAPVASLALDDGELIERARKARNGAKFAALWDGDAGSDASQADAALCSLLAFWTGRDAARVDSLFRRSGLMREKWDTRHSADGKTYGQMTVEKAVSSCAEIYKGNATRGPLDATAKAPKSGTSDFQTSDVPDEKPKARRLVPIGDLRNRPAPNWLLQRFLVAGATSLFTADSGSYKSFVALHIAYCVAHGLPFFGRGVQRGPVVYVAGEGAGGLRARSMAWNKHHERESPENLFVWEGAVQIANVGEVAALLLELEEAGVHPALIIFDTLNRCAEGLDENSARDMGLFCAGLERIKRATGAHVCVVHHNNASGKSRGSTALPGAFDTRFSAEREGETLTLRCQKQKDGAAEFEPFALCARGVEIGEMDEFGDPITSLVLEPSDKEPTSETGRPGRAKERTGAAVLAMLVTLHGKATEKEKVSKTDWEEAVTKAGICSRSVFYTHTKELENAGRWFWWKGDCRLDETPENATEEKPKSD